MSVHFALPVAVGTLLQRHSRQEIADAIEIMIDMLDAMDGDPDLEEDDGAGQIDEDGVNTAFDTVRYTCGASGPGCPITDPGGAPTLHFILPEYGDSQDTDPLNYAEAERAEKLAEMARAYAYEGRFEEAKKITARLVAIGHPAMAH